MSRLFSAALFCLLSTPCFAQQQTPADLALQINGVIGTWAQTITQQSRQIADLQKQIADKDAKIKELEGKKDEPK